MTEVTLEQAFRVALDHHRRHDLPTAEAIYRQILLVAPQHADSHHLLGVVRLQRGDAADALIHIDQALALAPQCADFHANRGECLRQLQRLDDAIAAFHRALALSPGHAAAVNNLAITLSATRRFEQAIALLQPLLAAQPDYLQGHNNLSIALRGVQRLDEALAHAQQAYRLAPQSAEVQTGLGAILLDLDRPSEALALLQQAVNDPNCGVDAQLNLANALARLARFGEAETAYQRALAQWPQHGPAWNNLGALYRQMGHLEEAERCLKQSLQLDPINVDALNNLGTVLRDDYRLADAETTLLEAHALAPTNASVLCNLGNVCELRGRPQEAAQFLRTALASSPTAWRAHSNLLFSLNYLDNIAPIDLRDEHAAWNRHGLPALPQRSLGQRPWRVGLVSPDFRTHPVGYFLAGILPHVDRDLISLHAYSDVTVDDAMTEQLRAATASWTDSRGLGDLELAQRVQADGIDILIDLVGHGDRHRLRTFSAHPAPRQVSWPGYFATTGLTRMDAILGDPWCTPTQHDDHFVEQVLRLPNTRLCYRPPAVTPEPHRHAGQPTFGSFNTLAKLTPAVIATWAAILQQNPDSRLFLKALGLRDPSSRERLTAAFGAHGILPNRLRLEGPSDHDALLRCYQEVDVALDPFPFTGGLTTFEALWMGVPVVTLIGNSLVARQGYSAVVNLGQPTWAVANLDDYIGLATAMMNDRQNQQRQRQREAMLISPLCDGRRFAAAWGQLLDQWCRD